MKFMNYVIYVQLEGQETIDALLYLAVYCRNTDNLDDAEKYCSRLLDFPGPEKEQAKGLLREIHKIRGSKS